MRIIPILLATTLSLSASPENPLIPATWFQDITATDGSTQQCVIFTTVPGVEYTFHHSDDLVSWTEIGKTYGLGHQFSAAMMETAPPPPPADPENPPPPGPVLELASIIIQRSSGTAGGSVVSWPSLDHGNAVQYIITGNMVAAWDTVPVFAESHGTHQFFVSHPPGSTAPPLANPSLDTRDAAMIADLEAAWSAFNTAVTTSFETARNTPPPPPPAPDARGFLRIKADWGLDSDGDGIVDHAEFALAAQGAGANGLVGNAFNPDTDGDGIPDGNQLDSDGDGTPDADDISPDDALIAYRVIALPRYAVFPIDPGSRQINGRGTVLYEDKVWKNGDYIAVADAGGDMGACFPEAMNDLDQIIGTGSFHLPASDGNPFALFGACFWDSPSVAPTRVFMEQGAETVHAGSVSTPAFPRNGGETLTGNRFTNGGEFHARSFTWDSGAGDQANLLWKIPAQGGDFTATAAPEGATNLFSADVRWGREDYGDGAGNPEGPRVYFPGAPEIPPFEALNIIPHATPAGSLAHIMMTFDPDRETMVFHEGEWKRNALLAPAVDIAEDGTAISKGDPAFPTSRIMANGKWTGLTRMAPDLPAEWDDSTGPGILMDTSSNGWILAGNSRSSAAMLPIRVKGRHTLSDNTVSERAVGVDDFSIGSSDPAESFDGIDHVQDRIWIMAPLGGPAKTVVVTAPLHESAPVRITANGIRFGGQAEAVLNSAETILSVTAASGALSGEEKLASIKMGSSESVSKPVGFKVMKKRTVKVTVYKIGETLIDGNNVTQINADLVPAEQELANFLNDFYLPQVNVEFSVEIKPIQVNTFIDHEPDGLFTGGVEDLSPDQVYVRAVAIDQAGEAAANTNVTVYLLGTRKPINTSAIGMAHIESRTCWVKAKAYHSYRRDEELAQLMNTTAHEFGHVLLGEGHPSERPGDAYKGPAPLPGTNHSQRLMREGGNNPKGFDHLLVKAEWDAAEVWLKREVDGD